MWRRARGERRFRWCAAPRYTPRPRRSRSLPAPAAAAEHGEHPCRDPPQEQVGLDVLGHRPHVVNREGRVELADDASNVGSHRGFGPRARQQVDLSHGGRAVSVREVHHRLGWLAEGLVGGGRDDAGDDERAAAGLDLATDGSRPSRKRRTNSSFTTTCGGRVVSVIGAKPSPGRRGISSVAK